MIAAPESRPAHSYSEALERARAFMALDDDRVLPEGHTALLDHGKQTPLAVVLFHGITNNPAQYAKLAPLLHERGANVFVPRMPHHGFSDRLSNEIAQLTAEQLLASAGEAMDIAAGLGERVAVLGISMGGSLSAFFAQTRHVAVAVPVAPDFALLQLPYGLSRFIAGAVRFLPNFFFWWDPRVQVRQRPLTAYPRCSTHALMQTLRIGDYVHDTARKQRALADRIVAIVNRCDPAVNNEATEQICNEWKTRNHNVEYVEMRNLPENHDVIDPQNPLAQIDLVYPKLIAALGL